MSTLGSTLIAEKNSSRLAKITDVDDLAEFRCLDLEVLTTLDFETIAQQGDVTWADGEPIRHDPGMIIFKVSPSGLAYVISQASEFDELQQADLRRLAEFVRANGNSNIYEFATF